MALELIEESSERAHAEALAVAAEMLVAENIELQKKWFKIAASTLELQEREVHEESWFNTTSIGRL